MVGREIREASSTIKKHNKEESKSFSGLALSIKKLIKKGYPSANQSLPNVLGLDHIVDYALPDPDRRLRLPESRIRDIGEAEIMTIRLKTYKIADAKRQKPVTQIVKEYPLIGNQEIISLLKSIQSVLGKNNQNSQPKTYFGENGQSK